MPLNPTQLVPLDAANPKEGSLSSTGDSLLGPLLGLTVQELSQRMASVGEPIWRGRQLAEALYRQRIADLSEITTLPKSLREKLVLKGWRVGRPGIARTFQSMDGTERYLIELPGSETGVPGERSIVAGVGETVETVWMPEGDGGETGDVQEQDPNPNREPSEGPRRATICVSSQVGCAVNCQFCLTAKLGLRRNLTVGEIAGQVVSVLARHHVESGRNRVNLVFMGMGEPFLNYDNFMAAVRLLVTEVGLSPQRMTVSTSGIVPGIERFAEEPSELRPHLAISLNAPNDQVREEIMPINRKWPIGAVIDAVRKVKLRPRERVTFEYVLLGNVTDRPEHAQEVARLVRRTGLPAKVNLIAWNPGPGIPYAMPTPESVEAFSQTLISAGIPAFLRKPRGRDIYAACGQLKRTVEG